MRLCASACVGRRAVWHSHSYSATAVISLSFAVGSLFGCEAKPHRNRVEPRSTSWPRRQFASLLCSGRTQSPPRREQPHLLDAPPPHHSASPLHRVGGILPLILLAGPVLNDHGSASPKEIHLGNGILPWVAPGGAAPARIVGSRPSTSLRPATRLVGAPRHGAPKRPTVPRRTPPRWWCNTLV